MARTMKITDSNYRGLIRIKYFDVFTDKEYIFNEGTAWARGPVETKVYGPFSSMAPVKRAMGYDLREYQNKDKDATIDYNRRMQDLYGMNYRTTPFYIIIEDFGIEVIQPSDWKRVS